MQQPARYCHTQLQALGAYGAHVVCLAAGVYGPGVFVTVGCFEVPFGQVRLAQNTTPLYLAVRAGPYPSPSDACSLTVHATPQAAHSICTHTETGAITCFMPCADTVS